MPPCYSIPVEDRVVPMPGSATTRDLLRATFQNECDYLQKWVDDLEAGRLQIMRHGQDISPEMAAEFRHRIGNLQGNLAAYERICDRQEKL
jgi:hypothetical protein